MAYTLKYMCKPKKITKQDEKLTGRQPEFSLMSKGLGKEYLSGNMVSWHKADTLNRAFLAIEDGKKIGMPRYYSDKIYNTKTKEKINKYRVSMESAKAALQRIPDLQKHYRQQQQSKQFAIKNMNKKSKKGTL